MKFLAGKLTQVTRELRVPGLLIALALTPGTYTVTQQGQVVGDGDTVQSAFLQNTSAISRHHRHPLPHLILSRRRRRPEAPHFVAEGPSPPMRQATYARFISQPPSSYPFSRIQQEKEKGIYREKVLRGSGLQHPQIHDKKSTIKTAVNIHIPSNEGPNFETRIKYQEV